MELSQEKLDNLLQPRAVRFYTQTDSTNDLALAWLRDGAAAGSLVMADEQLKGRGRKGRTWHTPPGVALALSVILRPPQSALHQVSMLGGLVISELSESLGITDVAIKWPNDVQIDGRKVSGVLPEIAWDNDQLLGVVLGMGVNIRVDFAGTDVEDTATSLETMVGQRLDRAQLVADLLQRVDYWSARFGSVALLDAWKSRLNTLGRPVTVTGEQGIISGEAQAVDTSGALLVRDHAGIIHRVMAGDIALG